MHSGERASAGTSRRFHYQGFLFQDSAFYFRMIISTARANRPGSLEARLPEVAGSETAEKVLRAPCLARRKGRPLACPNMPHASGSLRPGLLLAGLASVESDDTETGQPSRSQECLHKADRPSPA